MESDIITMAVLVVGGYLLGSVPAAYLIARAAGANVYEVGTRNPGAANTFREVGRAAGAAVFGADVLKGALPVIAGRLLDAPLPAIAAGAAAALLGHWLPVFMRFRGGAGLATAIGSGVALVPLLALIARSGRSVLGGDVASHSGVRRGRLRRDGCGGFPARRGLAGSGGRVRAGGRRGCAGADSRAPVAGQGRRRRLTRGRRRQWVCRWALASSGCERLTRLFCFGS